ncbi:MAG: transglycosylase SLT domain-containing protein [Candidatus Shapirobacteria bacterium]
MVVTRWDGSSVTTGLAPQSSASPESGKPAFDPTVLLKPEVVIPSLSILVILGLILIFVFIWFSSSENQVKAGMWIVEKISAREERRQNKARVLAERRNAPAPVWKLVLKEGYRIGTAGFFFFLVLIVIGLPAAATLQARLGWEKFLKDGWFLIPAKVFVLFVVALVFDWVRSVVRKHKQARDPKAAPGTTIVVYKERPQKKAGCFLVIIGLILLVTAGLYWWQVRPVFINIESDSASVQAWTADLDKVVEIANQWGWGITSPGQKLGEWAMGAYKLRQNLDIATIVAAILGLGMLLSSFSKRLFSLALVTAVVVGAIYVYGSKYIQASDPTVTTNPPSGETLITTPVLPNLPEMPGIAEQQPPATSGELHLSCDFNAIEAGLGPANITCDANGYPTFPIRYWNGNSYQFYIEPKVLNASISAAKGNDSLALLMLAVANSESSSYNSAVCSGVGACGTWQFMPGTWTSYAPAGYGDPSYRYDTNIQAIGAAALIGDGANGYGGMRLYTKLDRQSFVDCFYGRTCATWNQHEPQADYVFRLWTALKVAAGLQ